MVAERLRQHLSTNDSRPTLVLASVPFRSLGLEISSPTPIIEGPSAFYWLHTAPFPSGPISSRCKSEAATLLAGFRPILELANRQDPASLVEAGKYSANILRHIEAQTKLEFPLVDRLLGDNRLTRELGYEHQGLHHGLKGLDPHLRQLLSGLGTRKQSEKLELDLHHLLEHHLEREERCLVPLLDYIHHKNGLHPR